MTTTIEATYEQGVLRPAQPIVLPEGARVTVVVITQSAAPGEPSPAEFLAQIAALPIEGAADAFSGQGHDAVLYGTGRRA